MRVSRSILVASALCLLAVAQPAVAEEKARWPKSPEELAITLSAQYALEEGPLVCTVTLKNVSQDRLKYATAMFSKGAHCSGVARWKVRKED